MRNSTFVELHNGNIVISHVEPIKLTTFNKVFHPNKCKETKNLLAFCNKFSRDNYLKAINGAVTLLELLSIHKQIWQDGYHINSLSNTSNFRANCEDLNATNVYLGDIWGLWVNNIDTWEHYKDEKYGPNGFGLNPDIMCYDLIMSHYKGILKNSIEKLSLAIRCTKKAIG